MIEINVGDETKIMRVAGFATTQNKIDIRPQYETKGEQKHTSINVLKRDFKGKLRILEDGQRKG